MNKFDPPLSGAMAFTFRSTASPTSPRARCVEPVRTYNRSRPLAPVGTQLDDAVDPSAPSSTQCVCRTSRCLKLYCSCFGAGHYCGPQCGCRDCANNVAHEPLRSHARRQISYRNEAAFKRVRVAKCGKTYYRKGCRCTTSRCDKRYCECRRLNMRCSPDLCQCTDCGNRTTTDDVFAGIDATTDDMFAGIDGLIDTLYSEQS